MILVAGSLVARCPALDLFERKRHRRLRAGLKMSHTPSVQRVASFLPVALAAGVPVSQVVVALGLVHGDYPVGIPSVVLPLPAAPGIVGTSLVLCYSGCATPLSMSGGRCAHSW